MVARRCLLVVVALASALALGSSGPAAAGGRDALAPLASELVPVDPVRIEDSRSATAPLPGAWTAGQTRELGVTGTFGAVTVPTDATAVVLNVTVTGGTAASDLRLWPAGQATPNVSNLNWQAGDTTPNLVVVKVGADGKVAIRNQAGSVHVLVDLVGYHVASGDRYTPLDPVRIQDSRDPPVGLDGRWGPGQTRQLRVTGPLVPDDATAVVLNVTVTGGTAASNLRVWPTGRPIPNVSNLNWQAGDTVPNLVLARIGTNGSISIRNQAGEVDVLADLVGYYSAAGDRIVPLAPFRIQDSRSATAPLPGAWTAGQTRDLDVTGGGVPDLATAVVLNVTVTGGTAGSNLRLWPAGQATPNVSNLNWQAGDTTPNLVVVKVGADGKVAIRNQAGSVHVLVDVVGYLRHPVVVSQVVAVDGRTCARTDDGAVRCWGPTVPASAARPVEGVVATQFDTGGTAACSVDGAGVLTCWGGGTGIPPSPAPVDASGTAVATGVGTSHQCVLLAAGTVRCWGSGSEGQMGTGGFPAFWTSPLLVKDLTDAVAVTSGGHHNCAIRSTGTVVCWGSNTYGQLGDGTTEKRGAPVAVGGLTDVTSVDGGSWSTCAIRSDRTVWCWGRVAAGPGDDVDAVHLQPVQVAGISGAVTMSYNGNHGCVVDVDGALWCWGGNIGGQLGDGTTTSRSTPATVAGLPDVVGVAVVSGTSNADPATTCAWDAPGNVWCWGNNVDGTVGDGTTIMRRRPVPLELGVF